MPSIPSLEARELGGGLDAIGDLAVAELEDSVLGNGPFAMRWWSMVSRKGRVSAEMKRTAPFPVWSVLDLGMVRRAVPSDSRCRSRQRAAAASERRSSASRMRLMSAMSVDALRRASMGVSCGLRL